MNVELKNSNRIAEKMWEAKEDSFERDALCFADTATREYERARERLIEEMHHAKNLLARAIETLKDPNHLPNSLGMLQSQATEVDRSCGQLFSQYETAGKAQRLVRHLL